VIVVDRRARRGHRSAVRGSRPALASARVASGIPSPRLWERRASAPSRRPRRDLRYGPACGMRAAWRLAGRGTQQHLYPLGAQDAQEAIDHRGLPNTRPAGDQCTMRICSAGKSWSQIWSRRVMVTVTCASSSVRSRSTARVPRRAQLLTPPPHADRRDVTVEGEGRSEPDRPEARPARDAAGLTEAPRRPYASLEHASRSPPLSRAEVGH
jgi:hypothetical protein